MDGQPIGLFGRRLADCGVSTQAVAAEWFKELSRPRTLSKRFDKYIKTENTMTDNQIETEIQAKGLTAPRITPADIESNIAFEHYFIASQAPLPSHDYPKALDLLTFCVLVLRNGFTVTGESACASPENFDAEVGRKIARANATQKIWSLMGYELRSKLAGV